MREDMVDTTRCMWHSQEQRRCVWQCVNDMEVLVVKELVGNHER